MRESVAGTVWRYGASGSNHLAGLARSTPGGTGSAWHRIPPSFGSNQSPGRASLAARALRTAMLSARALGRWRTIKPSSSVVRLALLWMSCWPRPVALNTSATFAALVIWDVTSARATASGALAGCHVRVTKSPPRLP